MSMSVLNNSAAQISLGELNKSINKLGKALAVVASGQKLNSAKDDSAAFSISEQMRSKLRALEQDVQNVQNGSTILKTAAEGIQQQIELLKTVREKVIDANNDSNTDDDRRIMQKEINQLYDQMDQVAHYTDYNTKKVLIGDTFREKQGVWMNASPPAMTPDSDVMDVVENKYATLDGIQGPFDVFKDCTPRKISIATLGLEPDIEYEGGSDPKYQPRAAWSNADAWNFKGFSVGGVNYVLRSDAAANPATYENSVREIDIGDCSNLGDVLERIDTAIGVVTNHSSTDVTSSIAFYGYKEEPGTIPKTEAKDEVPGTGLGVNSWRFTGGKNDGSTGDPPISNPGREPGPFTKNISGAPDGSGFGISSWGGAVNIQFTAGNSAPQSSRGTIEVGKDYSGTVVSNSWIDISLDGDGNMTFRAPRAISLMPSSIFRHIKRTISMLSRTLSI